MAATAWVHRRDKLHPRREGDVRVRPGNADVPGFEGLPQRIEHRALELRKLVEEQHSEMRQADLAGTDSQTASDECRHRRAMVRRTERAPPHHLSAFELSRDRSDHGNLQRFSRLKRRENPRQAGCQQRLPGSGRAAHQHVVSSSGRDLEGALCDLLALHLPEVGPARECLRLSGLRRLQHALPLRCASNASRSGAATTSTLPAQAASAPCEMGQISPLFSVEA